MSKTLQLRGKKFGRLAIVDVFPPNKSERTKCLCMCTCGKSKIVIANNLIRGLTKSCGCLHREKFRDLRLIKIDRCRKFGRLRVISAPIKIGSRTFYDCLCDCGNIKRIVSYSLRKGLTQSCGCLRQDKMTTHGLSQTADYKRAKCAERRTWLEVGENYTVQDILDLKQDQNNLCFYCKLGLDKGYHVDHKTPLCRGGNNTKSNICISCKHCNLRKNRKTVEEFFAVLN